jgi:hypothetical protein
MHPYATENHDGCRCCQNRPLHIAFRIDSVQNGESASHYIDGNEVTVAEQKTIDVTAAIEIGTDNRAFVVEPKRDGEMAPGTSMVVNAPLLSTKDRRTSFF